MRCVFLLLVSTGAACEPSREPRAEPPPVPLVIGTSPPVATNAPPPEAPVAPDEPLVTRTTLAVAARDPRIPHGTTHRARSVLMGELQALEAQYAGTAASNARVAMAKRLADRYAELARASEGTAAARDAHKSAAKYYEAASAGDPKDDEAQYYAALEHELAGDRTNARRGYYEVVKNHPGSRLVAFAYFAFGEMFFAEADSDPSKLQLAEQAFREVLRWPPAQNPLYVEAQNRLAEINLRLGAGAATRP
jgi:tetratricopeptide (TPR) repeat protein